jgi:cardiolipin synthase
VNRKKDSGYILSPEVSIIRGGAVYFQLLEELIHKSERIIHLQAYILDGDETGLRIIRALESAAARGIKVYLIADGFASQKLSTSLIKQMEKSGIVFRFFEPLFKSSGFYFGRRMHHKVFVSDDKVALVGGINISNRYNDLKEKEAWLDYAILLQGPICGELAVLCHKTLHGFKLTPQRYIPYPIENMDNPYSIPVRMRRNDWVRRKNQISGSYVEMLRSAKEEIIILCSYFIPGRIIRQQLRNALRRGVRIKLILAGFSDVKIAKNAERFMYDWLLRLGVEIFEYKRNVLHGKLAIGDRHFITLGSYNLNDISAYASIELNIDVKHPLTAMNLANDLDKIMAEDCKRIRLHGKRYNDKILPQLISWVSYRIFRISFYLFTFYFKRQR